MPYSQQKLNEFCATPANDLKAAQRSQALAWKRRQIDDPDTWQRVLDRLAADGRLSVDDAVAWVLDQHDEPEPDSETNPETETETDSEPEAGNSEETTMEDKATLHTYEIEWMRHKLTAAYNALSLVEHTLMNSGNYSQANAAHRGISSIMLTFSHLRLLETELAMNPDESGEDEAE
ncbi:hypothetical protein [Bifidobacterium catulorum]|uniref:Uncharacterized protein n=1 Tax=Bifidobacterium catulorum TaxID=1630173 RepID=A0A2U2MUG3_9BIFI|nr:hypothetical protein [Bifidobacterium catulorum]PWG60475.1 hypothetical protein DF200_02445 [Bifidobacterium catulorum]